MHRGAGIGIFGEDWTIVMTDEAAEKFRRAAIEDDGAFCGAGRVSEYEKVLRALTGLMESEAPNRLTGYQFVPPLFVRSSVLNSELQALAALVRSLTSDGDNFDSVGTLSKEQWGQVQKIARQLLSKILVT